MHPRQTLLDQFSTFASWDGDRLTRWIADGRLQRSMKQELSHSQASSPNSIDSPEFWSLYWHRVWHQVSQSRRLAEQHLSAYLQEICYWSMRSTLPRVRSVQISLPDAFQSAIAQVPRLLQSFDANQRPSLKTYASTVFANVLRSQWRQQREIDLCSEWGLLLKLSRKQVNEALDHLGVSANRRAQFLLAWTCYLDAYKPTKTPKTRQTTAPNAAIWAEIGDRYNAQCADLDLPQSDVTQLEALLKRLAQQARSYLYPAVRSLSALQNDGEDDRELDIPDPQQASLLSDLIAEEERQTRQTQQAEIHKVLQTALDNLDPAAQMLLIVYYQSGITQQQLAKQMGIQQYTVSRRLTKARETLLLALTRWTQETLHTPITSDVVKSVSAILEEWLQHYYGSS